MYNISLDEKKKRYLLTALSLYKEELENIASACLSRRLKNGFNEDATEVGNLSYIIEQSSNQVMSDAVLCAFILEHLGHGDKIGAIKLVREQRSLGLKEAKDFVDNLHAKG